MHLSCTIQLRPALSTSRPTCAFFCAVTKYNGRIATPRNYSTGNKQLNTKHNSLSSRHSGSTTRPKPHQGTFPRVRRLPSQHATSVTGNNARLFSTSLITSSRIESVSPPDPTASYAAPITSPQDPNQPPTSAPASRLTWNAFLALRRTRRRYNLVASIFSSLASTSAGVTILARQNIEAAGVFGLDPFIVLGIATAGSGAVGWLMGPFIGNAVFGFVHRGLKDEIAEKEKDLYRRIKRHRVDPSSSSAGNPVPDYYGEKIGSVAEYRTWMKDQRAYNKRRQNFL